MARLSSIRAPYCIWQSESVKRAKPPLPSQATGPERIRLAMQICHHWLKLKQAQWGESTPTSSMSVLLRRLRHIHDGALLWGTSVSPPPVALTWAENDRATWTEWALATIPAVSRFLISSGVAHIHGTFCTHPIGNETRLQLGPSLGGALRPGGTNTMIDGLELPSTGDRQERWNCSDQDLRRHMALEIMKLSSDKTVPSKTSVHSICPFTMAAKEILLDPGEEHFSHHIGRYRMTLRHQGMMMTTTMVWSNQMKREPRMPESHHTCPRLLMTPTHEARLK